MKKFLRFLLGVGAVTLIAVHPAVAQTDTQEASITLDGAALTVNVSSGFTFGNVALTGLDIDGRNPTDDFVLVVNDPRGTGAGWTVNLKADGDLTNEAGNVPASMVGAIPIGNLSLVGAGSNIQSTDGGAEYQAPTVNDLTLSVSDQALVQAGVGQGVGEQTITIPSANMSLDLPYNAYGGTYNAQLTLTIVEIE